MIGSQGLLLLLGIAIFVFGSKRLPEISRSLGQALTLRRVRRHYTLNTAMGRTTQLYEELLMARRPRAAR